MASDGSFSIKPYLMAKTKMSHLVVGPSHTGMMEGAVEVMGKDLQAMLPLQGPAGRKLSSQGRTILTTAMEYTKLFSRRNSRQMGHRWAYEPCEVLEQDDISQRTLRDLPVG